MHEQLIASIPEDLLTKKPAEEGGCWIWWGPCSPEGAPLISVDVTGKKRHLTRVMYEHRTGKALPDEQRIRIECKNEACVNPEHLSTETYHQMMNRKRQEAGVRPSAIKRRAPNSKSPSDVERMTYDGTDTAAERRVERTLKPRKYYK